MTLARLSTQELLCGQINGEPLFNCDGIAAASEEAAVTGVSGNGIYRPTPESTVNGAITVQGIAQHPDFWKWQVDLLIDGVRETYIGSGGSPAPSLSDLVVVNTAMYPNGRHVLRLRVVRKDGNYDEYFAAINVQN